MFMVKDFWAVPEYAELLTQINNRIYPFVVGGEGTAKEALDGLAEDWAETFKKYGRMLRPRRPGRDASASGRPERRRQDTGAVSRAGEA